MSLGISTSQLARMRAQVLELLPDTAILQSVSYSGDDMGSQGTAIYTAVSGGTVGCRVDPLGTRGGQLELYQARETLTKLYQLTVPFDAPLLADYRVVINAQNYSVIQLDVDHSWNVSKRAIIAEVE